MNDSGRSVFISSIHDKKQQAVGSVWQVAGEGREGEKEGGEKEEEGEDGRC